RLQKRYGQLVVQHLRAASPLTPGPSALPSTASAFAATQAAWRFYANDRASLPALAQPLRAAARDAAVRDPPPWALVAHHQSALSYPSHAAKADQAQLHMHVRGYELTTALLLDGRTGDPIAPLELHLRARAALYSTRPQAPALESSWLDECLATMRDAKAL